MNTWTDYAGRVWPEVKSRRRLKFKYPMHAALRATVYRRDGFSCRRCGAKAKDVPEAYDGRFTLWTDTLTGVGSQDVLVVDHVLTLRAGGRNVIENFQTLCETCNRRKTKEDKAAFSAAQGAACA